VFCLSLIHHRTVFKFQLPALLGKVHDHDLHAKVLSRFLSAKTGSKAVVKKEQAKGFSPSQMGLCPGFLFKCNGLGNGLVKIWKVF
jgi:hypothetical protein